MKNRHYRVHISGRDYFVSTKEMIIDNAVDLRKFLIKEGFTDCHVAPAKEDDGKFVEAFRLKQEFSKDVSPEELLERLHHRDLTEHLVHSVGRKIPLIEAIADHIEEAEIGKCAFMDKYEDVHFHRGTGFWSLKRIGANGISEKQERIVRIVLTVHIHDADDYSGMRSEDHDVYVDMPYDMFVKFDKKRFDAIVAEQLEVRLKRQKKEAREKMEDIKAEFPDVYESFMSPEIVGKQ